MTNTSRSSGLCESCSRQPACTLPRAPLRPVVQCEEFANSGDGKKGLAGEKKQSNRPADPGRPVAILAQAGGLCVNCDDVAICALPDARKAVKHCEEYR